MANFRPAGRMGTARALTWMSGRSTGGSGPPKDIEGRIKRAVLEPLSNGNVTDHLSAKAPGHTIGGGIM